MQSRIQSLASPSLLTILIACGGGQSGTDQFDVERVNPADERDAGAKPNDTAEPTAEADTDEEANAATDDTDDTDTQPEPLPPIDALCDGSDSIRFSASLGSSAGGVPVAYYNGFLPTRFMAIDGRCRYWVNDDSLAGLRSGELSSDEAERLAEDLHFGQYGVLSAYDSPQCPDGGGISLTDTAGQLICRCGLCDDAGPAEFTAAFAAAWELHMDLLARDEWAWGPTSVLAIATDRATTLDWTLDLDLAAVAYDDAEQPFASDSGTLIDAPDQIELLSQLREQSLAAGQTRELLVRDTAGARYALFVRDELPLPLAAAIGAEVHR